MATYRKPWYRARNIILALLAGVAGFVGYQVYLGVTATPGSAVDFQQKVVDLVESYQPAGAHASDNVENGWDALQDARVRIWRGTMGFWSRAAKDGFHYGLLDPPYLTWWLDWGAYPPQTWWRVSVPLWVPTVPLLLATGAAWKLDAIARRRARAGFCAKCGYDLRGLREGAVCPECGADRTGKREGA